MTNGPRLAVGLAAAVFLASGAQAHPKLTAASPAANAAVTAPGHITLQFSEKLMSKFSGVDLTMTAMRGMKMSAPKKVPAQSSVMADGKTLMVMTSKPLAPGTYKVAYHVVGGDSHRITGGYNFQIK